MIPPPACPLVVLVEAGLEMEAEQAACLVWAAEQAVCLVWEVVQAVCLVWAAEHQLWVRLTQLRCLYAA